MKRPELNDKISIDDFRNFYRLKEELVKFCKSKGINTSGGKLEIAERITTYLATGRIIKTINKAANTSKFDWNNAAMNADTKITDNYKNTENVRKFMIENIGKHFRFNTEFMKWAKQNTGKTLGDAINEWKRIYKLKKEPNHKTVIAPQFEYNTYIRDFMADNPDKSIKDAIKFWKIKKNQKGDNKYSKKDIE
jgi:hypothetical protein